MSKPAVNVIPLNLSDAGEAYKIENPEYYANLVSLLQKTSTTDLFDYLQAPDTFNSEDTSEDFRDIFIEVVSAILKLKNNWSDTQLNQELEDYISSQTLSFDRPRVKACHQCGCDITEEFALALSTDALINNDKVIVVCPKCGRSNYFNSQF